MFGEAQTLLLRFIVDLLYNMVYNKTTTDQSNEV